MSLIIWRGQYFIIAKNFKVFFIHYYLNAYFESVKERDNRFSNNGSLLENIGEIWDAGNTPDALLRWCRHLRTCWRILSRKGWDMRCNKIARRRKRSGREVRGWYRSIEEDACCVAYTTSIFIHQPLLRVFFPGEEDSSTAAVFPQQNARCTVTDRGCRSREWSFRVGVTMRFVIAIASSRTRKMSSHVTSLVAQIHVPSWSRDRRMIQFRLASCKR